MNILTQFCGLLIMLLLLYFCLRQKSLWMATENQFLQTLVISIICVCFDILSIVAIVDEAEICQRTKFLSSADFYGALPKRCRGDS